MITMMTSLASMLSVISTRNLLANLYLTLEVGKNPVNILSFLVLVMQFLCNTIPMEFEVVIAWPQETLSRVNFWRLKLPLSGCLIKKPQKRIVGTVFDQFWRQFRALIVPVGTLAMRGCVSDVKNIVPFKAELKSSYSSRS